MAVSRRKLLSAIYTSVFRSKLALINSRAMGPLIDMRMTFSAEGKSAFTRQEAPNRFRITIGGGLVSQIASLPDQFETKAQYIPFKRGIVCGFMGLNFHELGHDLFTDMTDPIIVEYPVVGYRGFLHQLFNLIEDPIQEVCIANWYKKKYPGELNPKVYFNYMIEKLFKPGCTSYRDDGSIGSFMNYMLLMMRCGKSSIPNNNAIWDKYEKDILPQIKSIMYDGDGTSRLHKCVALGEWMIANIVEFKDLWEELKEPPEDEKKSGKFRPGPSTPGGTPVRKPMMGDPGTDHEEEEKPEEKEDDGDKGGMAPPEEDSISESPDVDDIFNDMFDEDFHEWIVLKDECSYDDSLIDELDKEIDQYSEIINDVTKFLELFNSRIRPRRTSGFLSGRLNVRKAMQNDIRHGCDIKLFDKEVQRGEAPDLAVSLVCDNSGSMSGIKSVICAKAALVLAQACEWANIPFECNAFTKTWDGDDGTCITLKIKDFEETFEQSKPFFAVNNSDWVHQLRASTRLYTFSGNSEEVNLFYIWQRLVRNPHKQKIVFVLCDGATTGSRQDLKSVIKKMEDEGALVIGLGVCTRDVQGIYPNHKVFNNTDELGDLAQYLIDTIGEYAGKR